MPEEPDTFSATPITNVNASGFGDVTFNINAPLSTRTVEIHVGTPDGPLFYRGGYQGTATAQGWVSDGLLFYLQDVSSNQPLTIANTIATVPAHRSSATFTASPLRLDPFGFGSTGLSWNVPGAQSVEVHVGSPTGPLFTAQSSEGWEYAQGWVTPNTVFYLCDVSRAPASALTTVATVTPQVNDAPVASTFGTPSGDIQPVPATISTVSGTGLGQTTVSWRAAYQQSVTIRVNSPTGPILAIGGPTGSVKTGNWVTNGMVFWALDQGGRSIAVSSPVRVIP